MDSNIIGIGLIIHGWSFKNIYVANLETLVIMANDPLKLKKPIRTC